MPPVSKSLCAPAGVGKQGGRLSERYIKVEEIKTTFNGKDGKGGLTLYANPFGTGKKFYGRFERDVLSMENLLSKLQEKNPGIDEIIVNTAISYIKREILAALKAGKAVNLLDLGELYIAATGSVADDSEVSELSLTAKFSPSPLLKEAVVNVSISNVVFSDTAPAINKVINWFTGEESLELTAGKSVVLKGKRLKLGPEDSALYLAPADEKGDVLDDESGWIDCTSLVRHNGPRKLEFYLPDTATAGSKYQIVIKSTYLNGTAMRKEPVYTYSDVVTISAA